MRKNILPARKDAKLQFGEASAKKAAEEGGADNVFEESSLQGRVSRARRLSQQPALVVALPGVTNDFYTNALDWTARNLLCVATQQCLEVHRWDAHAQPVLAWRLARSGLAGLKSSSAGERLATVDLHGVLALYDLERAESGYAFQVCGERASAVAWLGECAVAVGSRDGVIRVVDTRSRRVARQLVRHAQEVCGLAYRGPGGYLASGSNDNLVCVWDARKDAPLVMLREHSAAVRALAWSPACPDTLATGSGSSDATLRLWSVRRGEESFARMQASSQVCGISFSAAANELVSAQGYPDNNLIIWDWKSGERVAIIQAHTSRVLHLAASPDREHVATASPDGTLKIWRVHTEERDESADKELGSKFEFNYLQNMR